jgi:hypothetical protein
MPGRTRRSALETDVDSSTVCHGKLNLAAETRLLCLTLRLFLTDVDHLAVDALRVYRLSVSIGLAGFKIDRLAADRAKVSRRGLRQGVCHNQKYITTNLVGYQKKRVFSHNPQRPFLGCSLLDSEIFHGQS